VALCEPARYPQCSSSLRGDGRECQHASHVDLYVIAGDGMGGRAVAVAAMVGYEATAASAGRSLADSISLLEHKAVAGGSSPRKPFGATFLKAGCIRGHGLYRMQGKVRTGRAGCAASTCPAGASAPGREVKRLKLARVDALRGEAGFRNLAPYCLRLVGRRERGYVCEGLARKGRLIRESRGLEMLCHAKSCGKAMRIRQESQPRRPRCILGRISLSRPRPVACRPREAPAEWVTAIATVRRAFARGSIPERLAQADAWPSAGSTEFDQVVAPSSYTAAPGRQTT